MDLLLPDLLKSPHQWARRILDGESPVEINYERAVESFKRKDQQTIDHLRGYARKLVGPWHILNVAGALGIPLPSYACSLDPYDEVGCLPFKYIDDPRIWSTLFRGKDDLKVKVASLFFADQRGVVEIAMSTFWTRDFVSQNLLSLPHPSLLFPYIPRRSTPEFRQGFVDRLGVEDFVVLVRMSLVGVNIRQYLNKVLGTSEEGCVGWFFQEYQTLDKEEVFAFMPVILRGLLYTQYYEQAATLVKVYQRFLDPESWEFALKHVEF